MRNEVEGCAKSAGAVTGAAGGTSAHPKTRRVRFRFGKDGMADKYFVKDDIVYSHFVAGLSAGFPPGEEGFIRSVRRFADHIEDPDLKKRVAGFIGQEAMHGQEHRRLNEKLVELGYQIEWLDREALKQRLIRFEQRLPARVHLAVTAAAEHYTAVLAERTLGTPEIQAVPGDPEVWHLLNWHALEELEHKSVAFDVYRAVGGTERTRILVMAAILALTTPFVTISLAIAMARDPIARRQPLRLIREANSLFRGPLFRGVTRELAKYLRPGFHPDDIDTDALLKEWQMEMFGTEGTLVGHLK
ncbi:metal-dependent hydrolase [Mycolicibacterium komossense]|uniref:Metal-dependent hydrolase n=1 Tax=Mycolicibacterium komossense TaxID=1779 RepID=A0ABT3CG61_9MYCO|nr:metal-dependent hydrolase [Mycolicibacterium komossense]MCV7228372.1 metal-dependent hydrolase [Mycolicibacterium komossense]